MMKHTPTEWQHVYEEGEGHKIVTVGLVIAIDIWGWNKVEAEANARLIAAAPDLLEACMAFSQRLEQIDKLNPTIYYEFAEQIMLMRAAIALAGTKENNP